MGHKRRLIKPTDPTTNEEAYKQLIHIHANISISINPLGQVIAGLQSCFNLCRVHALVFGQIFGILPLKELDAILSNRLTPKVAIGRSLLILGLTEGQRQSNGTGTAIELDLDDIGDVDSTQSALLSAIGLHKKRQRLGNTVVKSGLCKRALVQLSYA